MRTHIALNKAPVSLRLREVLERVPVSKSTWWSGVKSGIYPQPVQMGRRITAWRESDIDALVERGVENVGQREGK